MKALVCGGRHYNNRKELFHHLDALHAQLRFTVIIEGEAKGADTLAALWASQRKVPIDPYPISPEEWDCLGNGAGPARNARMLAFGKPDVVIAFPGGNGTADMIKQAEKAGVSVLQPV